MSSSTTTLAEQTTITTECPLQTEVACFRIKGHGVDLIEGLYLGTGLINDRGLSVFGANAVPDDGIFYLTDSEQLISASRRQPLSFVQKSSQCAYAPPFGSSTGCSGCYCDRRAEGGGICVDDRNQQRTCTASGHCPADYFCDITIGGVCQSCSHCPSDYAGPLVAIPDMIWPGEALILEPNIAFAGAAATC